APGQGHLCFGPAAPAEDGEVNALESMTLAPLEVRRPEDGAPVFVGSRERIDALFVRPDPLTLTNRERIVKLAAQHKLTTMYSAGEFVLAGGPMAVHAPLTAAVPQRA